MAHYIQRVKQINENKHFSMDIFVGNLRQTGPFVQSNIPRAPQLLSQQQHISNWPTKLNSTDLITLQYLPHFNSKIYIHF